MGFDKTIKQQIGQWSSFISFKQDIHKQNSGRIIEISLEKIYCSRLEWNGN